MTKSQIRVKQVCLLGIISNVKNNKNEQVFKNHNSNPLQTLFTWSGGPRSSGAGFFCFVSSRTSKQKKPTSLDWGPPLHVNRVSILACPSVSPFVCAVLVIPYFHVLSGYLYVSLNLVAVLTV